MKPSERNNNKYKELLRKMQILSKNLLTRRAGEPNKKIKHNITSTYNSTSFGSSDRHAKIKFPAHPEG